MIRITIFSYSGDADVTVECVRCTRVSMPDAVISVVDDAADPIDLDVIDEIVADGASYRLSTFRRGGNLNGEECVRGILQELTRDAVEGDILVKIDPDTAVLNSDFLRAFEDSSVVYAASGDERQHAYGCCYAIRADIATRTRQIADVLPMSGKAPEDIVIARIVEQIYGKKSMSISAPWSTATPDSVWTAYNWQSIQAQADNYARRFGIVTVGSPRPPWHPLTRVDVMRQMREAIQ